MNSLDFEIGFVAVRVVNIGSNCLQLRYVKEVCRQGLWENQSGIWRVHSTPDLRLCQEMQLKGRCSYKEGVKRSLTSKAISNKGFVQRSEGIGQRRSENNTSPRARATDNTLTVQTDEKVPPPYDMRTLTPRLWPCCCRPAVSRKGCPTHQARHRLPSVTTGTSRRPIVYFAAIPLEEKMVVHGGMFAHCRRSIVVSAGGGWLSEARHVVE